MVKHVELESVHKGAYPSAEDPGAVGAGRLWLDLSVGPPFQLKVRNPADTGWQNVGVRASTGGGGGGGGGGSSTLQNEALVSRGASATASSETTIAGGGSGDQLAGNAIDANDATEWWTALPATGVAGAVGAWLEVDLGVAKEITNCRLFQGAISTYRATSSKLQSSDDGGPTGTWVDRQLFDAVVDSGMVELTAPITARYWRMLGVAGPINNPWAIRTLEVISGSASTGGGGGGFINPMADAGDMIIGTDVGGYDIATLSGTATASASAAGHGPALAIDNDDGTYWHQGLVAVAGGWVAVDLGMPYPIVGCNVVQGTSTDAENRADVFKVQSSTDGTSWTDVFTTPAGQAAGDFSPLTFAESTAQHWRILAVTGGGAAGATGWMVDTVQFETPTVAGQAKRLKSSGVLGNVLYLDVDGIPTWGGGTPSEGYVLKWVSGVPVWSAP